MPYKVFVDGQEGTTGLEINERLKARRDIEILKINPDLKKDPIERARFINQADIVFLCLPDGAAREAVALLTNESTRVLDASTAHRTADGWAYGIPELSDAHREAIRASKRVSVPGCFATGFNMLLHPLVKEGFVPRDCPVSCHAVTGYSGGGRSLIEAYEAAGSGPELRSPCFYALGLQHKHLPEMQKHSGLCAPPIFTPIIGNYYRGMTVAVPLHAESMAAGADASRIREFFAEYYRGSAFVRVMPAGIQDTFERGYLNAEGCNGTNRIEIYVFSGEKQILLAARFDNLGKGASGAAVQNMNIMLGFPEDEGLDLIPPAF